MQILEQIILAFNYAVGPLLHAGSSGSSELSLTLGWI